MLDRKRAGKKKQFPY